MSALSACAKKKPYRTEAAAKFAAQAVYEMFGDLQHSYKCPMGTHFHLGHHTSQWQQHRWKQVLAKVRKAQP